MLYEFEALLSPQAMLWYPSNQFVVNKHLYKNTLWYFDREELRSVLQLNVWINFNSYFLGVCLTLLALTVNFCISLQLFPLMLVCMTMTFGQISPEDCIIMHLRMTVFFVKTSIDLLSFLNTCFDFRTNGLWTVSKLQNTVDPIPVSV